MNVGELLTALMPYHSMRRIVVILEGHEERSYEVRSVDEIIDSESGKAYVFIACGERDNK